MPKFFCFFADDLSNISRIVTFSSDQGTVYKRNSSQMLLSCHKLETCIGIFVVVHAQ